MISLLSVTLSAPTYVATLPNEGQAVKCSKGGNGNPASVYKYTNHQVRWYPNPEIATSYDPNWSAFITVDCSAFKIGAQMPPRVPEIGRAHV